MRTRGAAGTVYEEISSSAPQPVSGDGVEPVRRHVCFLLVEV